MPEQPKPSILVVDDEVDTCRNLADILEDLDYDVDIAHDGASALQRIRRKTYDIALLDLRMPGMDGLTLYRRLRQEQPGAVALIVTAYATTQKAIEAIDAGVWQVLAKPVDFSKLLTLVEEAAAQPLVLVVDDDQDLCDNLWDMLRQQGYRVCLAHSEDQARTTLTTREFHVVLVDLKLPGGDGRNLLRKMQADHPQVRTILITGHQDEQQTIRQALGEGAEAVCYKPFDVGQLLQTIQQLTGRTAS